MLLVLIMSTLPFGVSWADPGRGDGRDDPPAHGREKEDEDQENGEDQPDADDHQEGESSSDEQGSASHQEDEPDPEPSSPPSPTPSSSPGSPPNQGAAEVIDVSFSASPASIAVGETSTLAVTITNPSSTAAEDAEVLVDLPAHLELVSSEPSASGSDVLRISLGHIGPGDTASATLVVAGVDSPQDDQPIRFAVAVDGETWHHELFVAVDAADPAGLDLAQSSPLLLQVGDTGPFSATVSNHSESTLYEVAVITEIAPELDVVGVSPIEEADAIQLGSSSRGEDIVWIFDSLAPGQEVDLSWTARAVAPGDLEAGNVVEATLQGQPAASSRQDTYLGFVRGVRTERPVAPAPVVKERVVTRFVPVSTQVAASVGGGLLPVTGWSPTFVGFGGALLIGLGIVLMWASQGARARRLALVLLGSLLLVGTACVSDETTRDPGADPQAVESASPEETTEQNNDDQQDQEDEDEVLGLRIDRSDRRGSQDDDPPAAPASASATSEPVTEIVYEEVSEVVSVVVPVAELPLESLGARDGDNDLSFTWTPGSNDLQASSSRVVSRAATEEILVALSSEGDRLLATVTVANLADDRRLQMDGRLALKVVAGDGRSAALVSDPIHVVLEPGASTSADLAFSLPSGRYLAKGAFLPEN